MFSSSVGAFLDLLGLVDNLRGRGLRRGFLDFGFDLRGRGFRRGLRRWLLDFGFDFRGCGLRRGFGRGLLDFGFDLRGRGFWRCLLYLGLVVGLVVDVLLGLVLHLVFNAVIDLTGVCALGGKVVFLNLRGNQFGGLLDPTILLRGFPERVYVLA